MGYTIDFEGEFVLDKPLEKRHFYYLKAFSNSRRMIRDASKAEALEDSIRKAVGLPIGKDGEYYVGNSDANFGQIRDESVLDFNSPPKTQPGLWCDWTPSEEGTSIIWNGSEKFYYYNAWLAYLIKHFLEQWGYILNGKVEWRGEDSRDLGLIVVENNIIIINPGKVVYY